VPFNFTAYPGLTAFGAVAKFLVDVKKTRVSYIMPMPLPPLISFMVAKQTSGDEVFGHVGTVADVWVVFAVPNVGPLPSVNMHKFWYAEPVVVIPVV
jgi:hypothetical protein